jgi:hypothetical protein
MSIGKNIFVKGRRKGGKKGANSVIGANIGTYQTEKFSYTVYTFYRNSEPEQY